MANPVLDYHGSCHCGAITFSFSCPEIVEGLKCNCSVCAKKNAVMSPNAFSAKELKRIVVGDVLGTYEFGSGVAKHHFCKCCGIYPFHQTMRKPGFYRVNLACVDGVDAHHLPYTVFDGASL